jgi:hypothetical protein
MYLGLLTIMGEGGGDILRQNSEHLFQLSFNKNLFCARSALTLVVIRGKGERCCKLAIMKFNQE